MSGPLEIVPVTGLPEVTAGDDLAALVAGATDLADGDVVVVASKVVSKAEGAVVDLPAGADPAAVRRDVARREAVRVVAETDAVLVVETVHGLVCANAGLDASNAPPGTLLRLPADPDASARALRAGLRERTGVDVGVVVTDTFGRPWRLGQTDVAIGVAGLPARRDERGGRDREGRRLDVTEVALADEVAGAADLVRRKADGVPVVVVRGLDWTPDEAATARELVRPAALDAFRRGRGGLAAALADPAGAADGADRPATPAEVARVLAAAAGAGDVDVVVDGQRLLVTAAGADGPVRAGVAAGLLVAAAVDAGLRAWWRPGAAGEDAVAVVVVGDEPTEPRGARAR